ncbi:MAG: alanine--tRNA ligase [Longimicrobiales bacterium]
MNASDIRQRFLDFFRERGHQVVASSSLVPAEDPTLLFTNAGMVQFKRVFLGSEKREYNRAVTSQKCVRAGGKHNDLEEVGRTARHHTFFEMLGNFSFGDYFKRDAIDFAWKFLVDDLGLDPDRMFATVHHTDGEAAALWEEVVGLPPERIYRLGDKDNFWQMADTGPCGPCSELHYDLRTRDDRGGALGVEEFEVLGEEGIFLELWNLVFMQYDRDAEGTLHPLPAPSIDTGAGLERIASVLQGVASNYDTDLFLPLLDRVGEVVGRPYETEGKEGVSFRVLADHARAVAFLLSDGVFPSNEGRGYVLRRILRRAVRHAWIMGRREPTLVEVVDAVVSTMENAYPDLRTRREYLLQTTRAEEERFLATIEGGMARFDQLAPAAMDETGSPGATGVTIPGEEVFRLYDTFGFPLDLTELMARERGFQVDVDGFQVALDAQRRRSRADRAQADLAVGSEETLEGWTTLGDGRQEFVGYGAREVDTVVLAFKDDENWPALLLRENPFYLEAGGQVSDRGMVHGDGWRLEVQDVRRVGEDTMVMGPLLEGRLPEEPDGPLNVRASVTEKARHDTERNHTATHLLHAALRDVLGEHVVQRGSLVAPDRLRFDFAHTAPLTMAQRGEVEGRVNDGIWADLPVRIRETAYGEAVKLGAMALFGEKYGERVRVVEIPGVSRELCGGTHCRHTGEIGLFRIVAETGVAAGVRRIEAVTGPAAFEYLRESERRLQEVAGFLKANPENAAARVVQLLEERQSLESLLEDLRKGGGGGEDVVVQESLQSPDGAVEFKAVRLKARDSDDVRAWGDGYREGGPRRVALVAAELPEEKYSIFTFVSDDLIGQGVRADALVREVAALAGGKGGGRPHMAQAGVGDPGSIDTALKAGPGILRSLLAEVS